MRCHRLHDRRNSLTGLLLGAAVSLLAACDSTQVSLVGGDLAFVSVTVVDVENGSLFEDRTVVIQDGRIAQIGPTSELQLEETVQIVRGNGRFLAPGLSDMHAHVYGPDQLVPYLANGVTLVRSMWGDEESVALREAVAAGKVPGPRLITAGPLLDGAPKIWAGSVEVANAQTAADLVAAQAAAGYDFVKVYSRLAPDVFDALAGAARKHDIEFSGHIAQDVAIADAVALGMRTAEHVTGLLPAVLAGNEFPNPDLVSFDPRSHEFVKRLGRGEIDPASVVDPSRVATLSELLERSAFWLVPTWDVMKNFTSRERHTPEGAIRYMAPVDRALVRLFSDPSYSMTQPELMAGEDVLFDLRQDLLRSLVDAGTKFLVGTDDSMNSGFVVVNEMQALVDAGISHQKVLYAATAESAAYLGESGEFGIVTKGATADLLLLDGDPLQDFETLRKPAGVMRAGIWYTREQLDVMLEDLAIKYDGIEAQIAEAPQLEPGFGVSYDFLGEADRAVRMATIPTQDSTRVAAAIGQNNTWTEFSITAGPALGIDVNDGELTVAETENGWVLSTGDTASGNPVPADVGVILTDTPIDLVTLHALVGPLAVGESREVAAWQCGPSLDCTDITPVRLTVHGRGRQTIRGHRIWEATDAAEVSDSRGNSILKYWMGVPGLFSGGPMRIEFANQSKWTRVL